VAGRVRSEADALRTQFPDFSPGQTLPVFERTPIFADKRGGKINRGAMAMLFQERKGNVIKIAKPIVKADDDKLLLPCPFPMQKANGIVQRYRTEAPGVQTMQMLFEAGGAGIGPVVSRHPGLRIVRNAVIHQDRQRRPIGSSTHFHQRMNQAQRQCSIPSHDNHAGDASPQISGSRITGKPEISQPGAWSEIPPGKAARPPDPGIRAA